MTWRGLIADIATAHGQGHHSRKSSGGARFRGRRGADSEKPECFVGIADQDVLRFLIVVEHHFVGLAAEARLLVSAESGMGRIGVIAVRPYAPGLDAAADPV